ncbi:hypothetical protein EDD18DRAFT_1418752 [Armillaria luteobubalina]|uniref:F-box domain-containing protein n=1 Tax=Armillaria luteobubalina TaxID=153913 RepID=A0AA39PSI4_9AGAR|nr:hypothetical protein EDD18DRAFT_1418752 [Armillaria luteobubalina]
MLGGGRSTKVPPTTTSASTSTSIITPMARRIHRGLLERMPDMSPEIWLEVVSYLDPLDLLRLAKVSADLYLVLTSPTSNALWKAARRTVDCPAPVTGLSELALADLLIFLTHTFFWFCRVAVVHKVKFSLLTRICKACYKEHVISHRATDPLTALMASLVPTVLKGITIEYLREDFEAIQAKYLSLPENEKVTYYTERRAYLKELDNACDLASTLVVLKSLLMTTSSILLEPHGINGDAIIKERLKDLGYNDAFLSENFCSQFYKHPAVNKPSDLDERGWTAIRDTIVKMAKEAMKELADKRTAGVLAVENRIAIATTLLEGPGPSRVTKVPSIVDFLDVPHHKTLIEAPVSMTLAERELKQLVDTFCDEWMDRTLDTLIQVLGEIQPERLAKSQKRTYLELAHNVFECQGFGTQEKAFMSTFIRAIGLDVETATVDDIDSLDQRYRCLLCPEAYHLDGKSKNGYECRPFVEHMDGHISGGTNDASYPQDFEIMHLEHMKDDLVMNDVQINAAPLGSRLPGCRNSNCLLFYMQK